MEHYGFLMGTRNTDRRSLTGTLTTSMNQGSPQIRIRACSTRSASVPERYR